MTDHPITPHLELLDRIVSSLGRRKRLREEDLEDFASEVRLKLMEDDGAALRGFRGDSSMKTFLTSVVVRIFHDFQRRRYGRWRPTAEARRRGTTAVRLETLVYRDGIPFEEAAEILRRNHGVTETIPELAELLGALPPRTPRQVEGEETLQRIGVPGAVDGPVRDAEIGADAERAEETLNRALGALSTRDRFLVRSLASGLKVSDVARMLGTDQKPLYRRRDRLRDELRRRLENSGLTGERVRSIVSWGKAELDFDLPGGDAEETP